MGRIDAGAAFVTEGESGGAMDQAFGVLRTAAGLSQQETADFLDVRLDTVKHWSSGRRRAPPNVTARMRDLIARQEHEARRLAEGMAGTEDLNSRLAESDEAARRAGWPCASAYNVMVSRAWSMGLPIAR